MTAISALGAGVLMWVLTNIGADKLQSGQRTVVVGVLIGIALLTGGLSGGMIARNRQEDHPLLFGMMVGAVSGAVCGACYALVMGIVFVAGFGGAPVGITDGFLVLLSYPVFIALGALTGCVPGMLLGALGSYVVTRRDSVATLVQYG